MRVFEFTKGYDEHQQLNPKLWDGDILRPEVKNTLLKIAKKFEEFVDLNIPVIDIQITGGQTTYHYTEHSDLDLHLIIDYDKVKCDQEVDELLDTKRLLFKEKHNISIRQIPVEPGTEDIRRPTVSSAYSIISDQWIRSPKNFSGQIDHEKIKKHTLAWIKLIDKILGEKDVESAKKLLKMIRKYRKIGLKTSGEYGVANLVYKSLRNANKVQKLSQFVDSADDQELTIQEY